MTNFLDQEMSWQLIDEFVKSEEGKEDRLVKLVINKEETGEK